MKYSVTECLSQIQDLTKKNLEILQGINDSFFTKQNHLSINIGDDRFVIPSFISLENKINALEENFTNLINSPKQGEAYFNIDGNCRSIEVKGYTHTPNSLVLNGDISTFSVLQNDIFKDFLTPVPKITFNLNTIPNDITSVNVKKIVPKNQEFKNKIYNILVKTEIDDKTNEEIKVELSSKSYAYGDIFKLKSIYTEDVDYIEYDTVYKLPLRKGIGSGTYIIEEVKSDIIDNDLNNIITIKVDNISYKLFDETIEKTLAVGDYLTTYDGSSKLQILEIVPSTKTLKLLVVNGEYTNFVPTSSYDTSKSINDLSKLKFYSPINFENDKYIDVPLEEDEYVFIAIAPVNDRMNVQAPWGTGVLLNTHKLSLDSDSNKKFNEYYKKNVKNIGDIIYEISNILSSNTISKLTSEELLAYTNFKPELNTTDMFVTRINSHINDSVTILNIRSLYNQKKKYQSELLEVQNSIDEANNELAAVSLSDTTGLRNKYDIKLTELNNKKIELNTAIIKTIDEISKSVNSSEVPLENSKYRIRGFYDYLANDLIKDHVIGIKVRYRYKNIEKAQGNALTIAGESGQNFIYTDWNDMVSLKKTRSPQLDQSGNLITVWEADNFDTNEPSVAQVDIPISQGESVDVKLKVIYEFGAPFVETTSNWSDIITFDFPDEYIKDVEILDIIEENNNDIETNRFTSILLNEGITSHINNKITDHNLTFFHSPNDIASGFYTEENRVISLATKLNELNASISAIQSDLYGSDNSALEVSLVCADNFTNMSAWDENVIQTLAYKTIDSNSAAPGYSLSSNGIVSVLVNIVLSNPSAVPIKIYPMFPGSSDTRLGSGMTGKFSASDYCFPENSAGVWMKNLGARSDQFMLQTRNQFITFRVYDLYSGGSLYSDAKPNKFIENRAFSSNLLSRYKECSCLSNIKDNTQMKDIYGSTLLPCIQTVNSLNANKSNAFISYYEIGPHQEVVIPLLFEYKLNNTTNYTKKTMSFDLRTSLYQDPVNYKFSVVARYEDIELDNIRHTKTSRSNLKYNSTIVL